jgi:alpha-1,2-mannosyltransferase
VKTRTLLLIGALYAAVVIPIGAHKGNSLDGHLDVANRLLDGERVYHPPPMFGTWWPPGGLALIAPYALVARKNEWLAKALFALTGVVCLVWALARAPAGRWTVAALALLAVAKPVQTDFETLNLNVMLLALVIATWRDLENGRETRAGVWLGLATAIKVFPALLIAYAAYRRHWRAAIWGGAVTVAVTLLPLVPRGVAGARETLAEWATLSRDGTAGLRGKSQSLRALVERSGASSAVGTAASVALIAAAAWWLRRRRPLFTELALVTHVAVLATPIVWAQNFVLLFPTWVAILAAPPPALPERWRRAVLIPIGITTSGVIAAWSQPVRRAWYDAAMHTWGALAALAVLMLTPPAPPAPPLGERPRAPVD